MKHSSSPSLVFAVVVILVILTGWVKQIKSSDFTVSEATIDDIQKAFAENKLTSTLLVDFYLERIRRFNPILRSVLEVNPDARAQAEEADRQRRDRVGESSRGPLHGIPVLLKDSIATNDKLNTTAGSYALVGSKVAREAHVVEKLRRAGAVILGKASLSEWYGTRSFVMPLNWCARGGLAQNPYVEWGFTCGSSHGSAISVAANMVAVSLGTETDGSIICPADRNSVVGIKPTVGLTSRAGVIPVSPRQDSIGPSQYATCTKLNCDGSSKNDGSLSGCVGGGVLLEALQATFKFLGSCSAEKVEIWGVFEGLQIAWRLGHERVEVNVDVLSVVNLLCGNSSDTTGSLVLGTKAILQRNWEVKISHISRDSNRLADRMVSMSVQLQKSEPLLRDAPDEIGDLVLLDAMGCPSPDPLPICRTVSDAVHVLDVIVGFDPTDEATHSAAQYIPLRGYNQFLKQEGLKGKRIGIVKDPFSDAYNGSLAISVFEHHLNTLRARGATVVDNLEIPNISIIQNPFESGETVAMLAEFKLSINNYLKDLISSPVRSLADIIQFNIDHPDLEKTNEYGQDLFVASEMTSGFGEEEIEAMKRMNELSEEGFEKVMKENELDGLVTLGSDAASMLAIGGYPAITVPAGYDQSGMPFGICFGGLKGTEPKLIEIAFDFEQSTKARKPPPSSSASL